MTIFDLGDGLNAVKEGLDFAHFAWSPAPPGDYGTFAESDESRFRANNRHAEQLTIAYVNLFTRDDTGAVKEPVEDFFRSIENGGKVTFSWYLSTVQFEEETGYIHYEWLVEFSNADEY